MHNDACLVVSLSGGSAVRPRFFMLCCCLLLTWFISLWASYISVRLFSCCGIIGSRAQVAPLTLRASRRGLEMLARDSPAGHGLLFRLAVSTCMLASRFLICLRWGVALLRCQNVVWGLRSNNNGNDDTYCYYLLWPRWVAERNRTVARWTVPPGVSAWRPTGAATARSRSALGQRSPSTWFIMIRYIPIHIDMCTNVSRPRFPVICVRGGLG